MIKYILFLTCPCIALIGAAESLDAGLLVQGASERVRQSQGLQLNLDIAMEVVEPDKTTTSQVEGHIVLGAGNNCLIHFKSGGKEVRLFNNDARRSYYVVHENSYRTLKPASDRRRLFDDVLGGPAMHFCQWLGDFLHGLRDVAPYRDASPVEISGEALYDIRAETGEYDMRLVMSKTDPPEIRRVEMNLKPASARRYTSSPDTAIRLIVELEGWRFNAPTSDELFAFNPPAGVTNADAGRAAPPQENTLEGNPAPDFTLDMLDGDTMQLSAHKGKHIVILDFWASWCGPCRTAMPIVARVAEQFKEKGVVLYAVNLRETPDRARAFLDQTDLSLKTPMDTTGAVAAKYGVTAIPRLIIIDKDGLVAKVHPGMSPDLESQLTRDIQSLIN